MNEKNVAISQQTLVSNIGDENVSAKKLPQYIASLSSTLGALAVGMVLGWTNSAGTDGASIETVYGIQISPTEFSWIGSLTTLGSGVMVILTGFLTDFMGRKYAMLLMIVPFTIGWLLIIFANSVLMLYLGRFIVGLGAGAFGLAAPMYSAEIAEKEIRGRLGSYFQLLLTTGILLSYIFGSFVNIRTLSIISAIVPFIFFGIFMFMPESPIYYLKKGNEDALVSLCIFSIMFNLGFGPLPWMILGELFAPEVKGVAGSSACLLNTILAFIVTKFYDDVKRAIDIGPTFWLFSGISAIGTLFVYFVVPQYIASLSSTLGALAVGMVLGWTNSAGTNGASIETVYGIEISSTEFSWIGSLATLGAGVMCILIGILADFIGRKYAMLLMVVPFTIGWLLIIFANSVLMFYIGRFISGLSAGAFCVAAPMYSAEIAEKEIRGRLGSYFQLLLTVGILLSYILGSYVNIRILSIISAIVPFIFFAIFMFMPETPIYYLQKGNEDAARKSLIKLRGNQYNVENELQKHQEDLEENARVKASFFVSLKSRATVKSFIISYGLMFFQQLGGVNIVIFYVSTIFAQTGSDLTPSESSIIVGAIQVIAVFVSTLVVDRVGRRILLLLSAIFMCLTTLALGIYFYLSKNGENVDAFNWLPLVCICIFIIVFSLGFGPLPWMMVGELFAPEVKGVAASSAGLLNWFLAFVVTKFYDDVQSAIETGPTFWLFSVVSAIGTVFVYLLVPETKGKSLIDIQRELNN